MRTGASGWALLGLAAGGLAAVLLWVWLDPSAPSHRDPGLCAKWVQGWMYTQYGDTRMRVDRCAEWRP